ncbi:SH3 domain-containing protein [Pontibacter vulgaris]|uniref:SH3 domain-containing protein n=1 Tax=Pontibacter vulgaris TaxID=2905679 RepID=UPI001FA74357|nr:SH3 domain-containing protein [Pontibacter vulgaris]
MQSSKPYLIAVSQMIASLLFLFIGFLPQLTFAAESYQPSDKLFVAPTTGANIRTEPSLQAPVLAKLKYNTVIIVVTDTLDAQPLQITVPDFNEGFLSLQGHWVKVKAGTIIGYVFDGMLSKYKGLELGNHDEEAYYAATFGKPATKTIPKSEVVQGHTIKYETIIKTYPKGLVEEYTFSDDCHDFTYTFKLTFNEVYWLINRIMIGADAVQEVKIKKADKGAILTFYSCT